MKQKSLDRKDGTLALHQRVSRWCVKLRLAKPSVRVQKMTRKWASCSTRGRITLARDLSQRPRSMQDYVIVHELLHLRYPNHGKLFKAVMSAHLPGWRKFEIRTYKPTGNH